MFLTFSSLLLVRPGLNPYSLEFVLYAFVLTTLLHHLDSLALWWPSQAEPVRFFNQVLLSHLRTLHLSVFSLVWRKGARNKHDIIHMWFLSLRVLKTTWENLLKAKAVLLETCWAVEGVFLFSRPTYTYTQNPAVTLDSKSLLDTNKWRNENVSSSSSFLSCCLWCFPKFCYLLCCVTIKWSLTQPVAYLLTKIPQEYVRRVDPHTCSNRKQ